MKQLGETQRALLARLQTGRAATLKELIEAVWGEDPDGGPDDAPDAVRVALRRLKRRGVPIERERQEVWRLNQNQDQGVAA
ncbi:hypothetical protein [Ferrovibrio terrae]|uniref:hypothetical protein n=1 Tax=Ferrovibrio terrae TaxID=2594003 RepID=UPI003137C914